MRCDGNPAIVSEGKFEVPRPGADACCIWAAEVTSRVAGSGSRPKPPPHKIECLAFVGGLAWRPCPTAKQLGVLEFWNAGVRRAIAYVLWWDSLAIAAAYRGGIQGRCPSSGRIRVAATTGQHLAGGGLVITNHCSPRLNRSAERGSDSLTPLDGHQPRRSRMPRNRAACAIPSSLAPRPSSFQKAMAGSG